MLQYIYTRLDVKKIRCDALIEKLILNTIGTEALTHFTRDLAQLVNWWWHLQIPFPNLNMTACEEEM